MGVLPCSRAGCENIMCDRHSNRYGYICTDCLEQLVVFLSVNETATIEEFMKKPKLPDPLRKVEHIRNALDEEFQMRDWPEPV